MQPLYLYGIANCDTVKKARHWLAEHRIEVSFVDFKKTPPTPTLIEDWMQQVGWEALLKKTGTTWRSLDEARKNNLTESSVSTLLVEQPNLIKRPLLIQEKAIITLGFKPEVYQSLLL